MSLAAYVMRSLAFKILAAAAVLLGVLQILDLLDVTTDILDRGLGFGGVAYYAALRTPRLLEQVIPLAVLAGGIFAFAQLARESGVIAMRAAGVSVYRLAGMGLPVALLAALIHFIAAEIAAPRADPALEAWWSATAPKTDDKAGPRAFRSGADIVVAQSGPQARGARLTDIRIYRRDADGRLVERIEAPLAVYRDRAWRLQQPKVVRFIGGETRMSTAAELTWDTRLRPADVQVLLSPDQTPSAANARRALTGGGSERPASFYAMRLQQAFAAPLAALVMMLLTVPVALGNFRTREGAVLTVGALGAGLVFLVVNGLLGALGEGGMLAPILAAWSAPLVFVALTFTVLLRMEG